jgi:serine/threonine protein phosphatase PrpC
VARGITNEPSVVRHTLRPGADLALVTVSDGVTDVLSDADIGRLVVRVVRKVGERLAGEGAGGWSSGSWWT